MSDAYADLSRRRARALALGAGLVALVALLDLLTGPAFLSPLAVARSLFAPEATSAMNAVIVRDIRLPMTLTALAVGGCLGVGGAVMQTILGNPLASPFTLGVSAAAGFGASLAILTGATLPFLPFATVPLAAFAGALGASGLVWGLSRLRGMSPEIMVLAGVATLFLFQALQSAAQYLASPEVLQSIVFWLFGSLLKAGWPAAAVTWAALLAGMAALAPDLWRLTALRLGDARAAAVGVEPERLRRRAFAITSALAAGAVAFVGVIGFVGLVAPHLARALVGEDHRFLIPGSALAGALIVCGASILSKIVSPGGVIPIGIVTALVGVPFLFALILKGRRRFW